MTKQTNEIHIAAGGSVARAHIPRLLTDMEKVENVTIICAIESGSRAWGFPSADSDHDIRMIYVRPLADYLTVIPPRDVIERPITFDEVLGVNQDIAGWDIRKALYLACQTNSRLLEWLQSPIVYRQNPGVQLLIDFAKGQVSLDRLAYSYDRFCRKSFSTISGGSAPTAKAYCYAARTALAYMWIRNRREIPPMDILSLLTGQEVERPVRDAIAKLIAVKAGETEVGICTRNMALDQFIDHALSEKAPSCRAQPPYPEQLKTANEVLHDIILGKSDT